MQDSVVIPIGAIGTGKKSWQLAGGFQIAGVTIDNPSGSWLWIPDDNTFIPPYRLGFAHTFAPTQRQISILFSNGPSGQVSTIAGDDPSASIYDRPVAESAGTQAGGGDPFIAGFTPVHTALVQTSFNGNNGDCNGANVVIDGVITNIPAGPQTIFGIPFIFATANKRIRLLTLTAALLQRRNLIAPAQDGDGGVDIDISPDVVTLPQVLVFTLRPDALPTLSLVFPAGLDFAVSQGVVFYAFPHWSTVNMSMTATYHVI